MPDPETEELRLEQIKRERAEREQAAAADEPAEERQHERRADRAAYLKEKLDERAESEESGRPRRMTEDHEDTADAAERELADMEERSERVGEHIDDARKDWEAKQADDAVPGARAIPTTPLTASSPPDPRDRLATRVARHGP